MTDIVQFLEARIAEDEEVVTQLVQMLADCHQPDLPDAYPVGVTTMGLSEDYGIYMSKIRLVAECRAKRAVMDELIDMAERVNDAWPSQQRLDLNTIVGLQHMAMVYIDHPDFDGKWLK